MKLQKGDRFPDFVFSTQKSDNLRVKDVLKGKSVFLCLRYIGCTVCRYDVHLLSLNYEDFVKKNAQVFVLMQSDREHVLRDLAASNTELPFEIICDPEMKIYDLLGMETAASKEELIGEESKLKEKGALAKAEGFVHGDYEGNELQLPALFIVDENGIVEYARYARDITDLPKVPEIAEMI